MVPIIIENEDKFHELVKDVYDQVTQRVSFAKNCCEEFLDHYRPRSSA